MSNDNIKEIGKLSRLFSTVAERPVSQAPKTESGKQAADPKASEAVKLSVESGTETSQEDATARAERVKSIKAQVDSGSYKPDTKAVAEAVIKDLFM